MDGAGQGAQSVSNTEGAERLGVRFLHHPSMEANAVGVLHPFEAGCAARRRGFDSLRFRAGEIGHRQAPSLGKRESVKALEGSTPSFSVVERFTSG